ncbi:hypothetical protein KIPB_007960 [Kipferlia bialata]|uniref:Uncharacterized protein n=1 Tax=Kipferlia bialata TaxID=797122 RepID=A0A9K3GL24_9EUKA|nr:hypothetical protein KIPB_007960 [Kipferlia bialata]|eukprot:g7960.t1
MDNGKVYDLLSDLSKPGTPAARTPAARMAFRSRPLLSSLSQPVTFRPMRLLSSTPPARAARGPTPLRHLLEWDWWKAPEGVDPYSYEATTLMRRDRDIFIGRLYHELAIPYEVIDDWCYVNMCTLPRASFWVTLNEGFITFINFNEGIAKRVKKIHADPTAHPNSMLPRSLTETLRASAASSR